jgi:hypothetical protein
MSPTILMTDPLDTDVLCGRGRAIRIHPGNRVYLQLITKHRTEYMNAVKGWKLDVVKMVVQAIRNRNGRFLQRQGSGWTDIGDPKAITKTSQAFRDLRVGSQSSTNMEDQESSSDNPQCPLTGDEIKGKKKKKPFQIGSWTRPVPVSEDILRRRQRPSSENSSLEDEVSETETEDSFPVFKGQQAQACENEEHGSSSQDDKVEEGKESSDDGSEQESDDANDEDDT